MVRSAMVSRQAMGVVICYDITDKASHRSYSDRINACQSPRWLTLSGLVEREGIF